MPRDPRAAVQFAPSSNLPLTVFLCNTSPDLGAEREGVLREITRINDGHLRVKVLETDLTCVGSHWMLDLNRSDLVILLVGSTYGKLVPGYKVCYGEAQYRDACTNHKSALTYFRRPYALTLRRYLHGHSSERALLDVWKQTIEARQEVRHFATPENLCALVSSDLGFIVRAVELANRLDRAGVVASAVDALDQVLRFPALEFARKSEAEGYSERYFDLGIERFGEAMTWTLGLSPGQCKRVTAFAIAIGRSMALPQHRVRSIARSSFVIDVGKLAISREIRNKVELTDAESAIVRHYPLQAYDLLRKVPILREAAEVAYAIEEKYDGTGYPRGLAGELIPLGSRVISIARSFEIARQDAQGLLEERVQAARRLIEQGSGKQFDPHIVKTFMAVPANIWCELVRQIERGS